MRSSVPSGRSCEQPVGNTAVDFAADETAGDALVIAAGLGVGVGWLDETDGVGAGGELPVQAVRAPTAQIRTATIRRDADMAAGYCLKRRRRSRCAPRHGAGGALSQHTNVAPAGARATSNT